MFEFRSVGKPHAEVARGGRRDSLFVKMQETGGESARRRAGFPTQEGEMSFPAQLLRVHPDSVPLQLTPLDAQPHTRSAGQRRAKVGTCPGQGHFQSRGLCHPLRGLWAWGTSQSTLPASGTQAICFLDGCPSALTTMRPKQTQQENVEEAM